jgi:hypothetical protein
MPTRVLLSQLAELKKRLEPASEAQLVVLAVACAERLWPVYERASQDKAWQRRSALRALLDAVWDWALGKSERPHGHAVVCEEAVDIFDQAGIQEDADGGGHHVAIAMYNLAASVESRNREGLVANAQLNLDFLDAFLCDYLDLEVTPENDAVIDAHELMVQERHRQDAHASLLLARDSLPVVVSEIRGQATGVSVLGEYWYG